ncbi:MAG: hypothetical protein Q9182_002777 [Xanthomendoza sp. 2 TL-2023]
MITRYEDSNPERPTIHHLAEGQPLIAETSPLTSYPHRIAEACRAGDVHLTHCIYSSWLQQQIADPLTGHLEDNNFLEAGCYAAANDHSACLGYLCQQGLKIHRELVLEALRAALRSRSTKVLKVLLDHGWDINEPQSNSEPPFMGYVEKLTSTESFYNSPCTSRQVVKDETLLRWFLVHGADPNASAEIWDVTPLSYAVQCATFDNIKLMFAYGGSTSRGQLLNMASGRTDPDCVQIMQYLFDKGDIEINNTYNEDHPELEGWSDLSNQTPLHHAASSGNIEAVRWLLERGANPTKREKCRNRLGDLPYHAALRKHHMEIVDLLIQATVDTQEEGPPTMLSNDIETTIAELYRSSSVPELVKSSNGKVASSGDNYALQDYSMLLMLLERERDRRASIAHRERGQTSKDGPGSRLVKVSNIDDATRSQEQEIHTMLEEQQAKKNALMARSEQYIRHDLSTGSGSAPSAREAVGETPKTATEASSDISSTVISSNCQTSTQSKISPLRSGF